MIKFVESRGHFYLLFISDDASLIAPSIYYSYIARDTIISTTNDRLDRFRQHSFRLIVIGCRYIPRRPDGETGLVSP